MSKAESFSVPAITCPVEEIQEMVRDTRTGKRQISIPLSTPPKEVPAHTVLTIRLFQDCLVEDDITKRLNKFECGFLGSIIYNDSLSDKQRHVLKKIAINRMGFDIDANTVAAS